MPEQHEFAALLRAVARLRPRGSLDPALVAALAALIMPQPPAPARAGPQTPEPMRPRGAPAVGPAAAARGTLPALQVQGGSLEKSPSRPHGHDTDDLVANETLLEQVAERADLAAPRRGQAASASPPPRTAAETLGTVAPMESLFAPGRVRAILRELATLSTPSGQPDINAVVALIARGTPIDRLPRRMLSTLGHSVQVLFDTGPAMLPFARDKQQFAATALRLLGKDRVRVADFIGNPLQGVRAQRQVHWSPLHWPGRQSAVVVVSDLGLGGGVAQALAAQAGWRDFVDECGRRGLRCVVLIPYPAERWPAAAAAFSTALAWDTTTGVQALHRSRGARQRDAGLKRNDR